MKSLQALSLLLAVAHSEAAFSWNNVRLGGGGGFVSGIVFHPKTQGVAYARTDIGGLYKLNSDDSWRAVTDDITQDGTWHNWGIDALALDPQNAQVVYAALGMYTNFFDNGNGAIAKSTDQGSTWSVSNLPFKVGGNMPGRGTGERLAVDPANSNIIYFGARSGHGLWKSSDGGVTFSNVASFTNTGTFRQNPSDPSGYQSDLMGLLFVTFDSTSPTVNGATSRIFVGVADNVTASIYVSTDAGSTWSPLAGQPTTFFPHKCKLQPIQKSLYLTYSNGMGPYDGSDGAVWRYDLTGGSWTNITPDIGQTLYFGFGGLGVDMLKPGYLVVASLNSWWPNAQLFRSNNSGVSWSPIWEWHWYPNTTDHFSVSSPNAPWIKNSYWDNGEDKDLGWMIEALEIDPFDSNHWLYGTGMTVMGGHDLTSWDSSHHVSITTLADGIEETSIQSLVSAPGGSELLAAVGDISGFTFSSASSLATAPSYNWMNPKFATSTDVDYAGQNVAKVVRSGNGKGTQQIGISNDGGITWSTHSGASTTAYGGTVAYSASGDAILWSTANEGVLRSQNINTFTSVSSLPSNALIASDKQNSNYFYAGSSSNFYISSDNGQSFFSGGSLSGASRINYVIAHPTTAGQVYVSTNAGIYMSTNFGRSFMALTTALTNVSQIALGVGPGSTWYLYAFGAGYNGNKLYGSADNGNSWTDLQGARGFGQITQCKLTGSGNVAGQVYVGTNGRGIFVAQGSIIASTSTVPTPTPTPTTSSPTTTLPTTTPTTTTPLNTTTVGGGATIFIPPGVFVVVGGPGGGVVVVGGVPETIAPGEIETVTNDTPTSTPPSTSPTSTTTTTTTTTSTSSSTTSISTPTETPSPYIIFPIQDISQSQVTTFQTELEQTIGALNVAIYESTDGSWVFWTAKLNSTQVSAVAANSAVGSVAQDRPVALFDTPADISTTEESDEELSLDEELRKRDGLIITQTDATKETQVISQSYGSLIDTVSSYRYDSTAGSSSTIYIMDTGANIQNPELANIGGSVRWLYATANDQTPTDENGHGSCVASKAVGVKYGIAKNANLVIVKLGFPFGVSNILWALQLIIQDVQTRDLKGKAVINMSLGDPWQFTDTTTPGTSEFLLDQLYNRMSHLLIQQDVVIVCASGNFRTENAQTGTVFSDDVTTWPSYFARQSVSYAALPLIVVGSVDNYGTRSSFSQGTDILTTSAPGINIECASKEDTGTQQLNGTSFSAPAVAGLAAYFLSMTYYDGFLQRPNQVASQMQILINGWSWVREANGPKVAWNNIGNTGFCLNSGISKRDGTSFDGSFDQTTCPSSSTLIAISTTPPTESATATATSTPTPTPPANNDCQANVLNINSQVVASGCMPKSAYALLVDQITNSVYGVNTTDFCGLTGTGLPDGYSVQNGGLCSAINCFAIIVDNASSAELGSACMAGNTITTINGNGVNYNIGANAACEFVGSTLPSSLSLLNGGPC